MNNVRNTLVNETGRGAHLEDLSFYPLHALVKLPFEVIGISVAFVYIKVSQRHFAFSLDYKNMIF